MKRAIVVVALAAGFSCSSSDATTTAPATLLVTTGKESDALTQSPLPARIVVTETPAGGATKTIADAAWPLDSLSLGDLDPSVSYAFAVEFHDASGAVVLRGATPSIASTSIAGATLPVLCGRTGAFARPSGGLTKAWKNPVAVGIGAGVLVAGAGDGSSEAFDLATLASSPGTALPIEPATMAGFGDGETIFLVSLSGAAALDLGTGESAPVVLGDVSAADLAGGAAIAAPDGGSYVVGATRDGTASAAVLRLQSDGTLTGSTLATPRAGAAATYVPGVGLVVAGGASSGTIELLAAGASAFTTVQAGVPEVHGAVALSLRPGEIVLVGGDENGSPAPSFRVPVACGTTCATTSEMTPFGSRAIAAFSLGNGAGFVVGEGDAGTVAAIVRDDGETLAITDVPLRAPRHGATAVLLSTGYVAIVGGTGDDGNAVPDVEIFIPP